MKKQRRKRGVVVDALRVSRVVLVVKDPPDNAGDGRNASSIPGSEKSPGGDGMETHSSILAWRMQRTGEPGRLQSMGSQMVEHN